MKKSVISTTGLLTILALAVLVLFACNKEQDLQQSDLNNPVEHNPDVPGDPPGQDDQDIIYVEEEGTMNDPEPELRCKYTVKKIVSSDDPNDYVSKGMILCYECPTGNKCKKVDCLQRSLTLSYSHGDYTTTVEISGGGEDCAACTGKNVQGTIK